jgi:hypothetical protein
VGSQRKVLVQSRVYSPDPQQPGVRTLFDDFAVLQDNDLIRVSDGA